jgi:hypothetical protein
MSVIAVYNSLESRYDSGAVGDRHARRALSAIPSARNSVHSRSQLCHAISGGLLLRSLYGEEEAAALTLSSQFSAAF